MDNGTQKEEEILIIGVENMIIPECCREGWESCPHVPKRQRVSKKNIGM